MPHAGLPSLHPVSLPSSSLLTGAFLAPPPRASLSGVTLPRGAPGRFAVARGEPPPLSPLQPGALPRRRSRVPPCARWEVCSACGRATSLQLLPSFSSQPFVHPSFHFLLHWFRQPTCPGLLGDPRLRSGLWEREDEMLKKRQFLL